MKVLCDVCKGEEAAVYCCADEAALCGACDARVHRANKLAGKHRRFSLLHPASPQQFPLCDICQEKRALLFCREDRAILCRDCDAPIHSASDLTKKHSRFLLTGIKLSPSAIHADADADAAPSDAFPAFVTVSTTTSDDGGESPGDVYNVNPRSRHGVVDADPKQRKKLEAAVAPVPTEPTEKNSRATTAAAAAGALGGGGGGGSSISEYLIKELPGWRVEDLLDASPAAHPAAFAFSSKMVGENLMPFLEADLDGAAFPSDDAGDLSAWWVPQVAPALPPLPPSHDYGQQRQQALGTGMVSDLSTLALSARQLLQQQDQQHRWASDDCFTVPEISPVQHTPPSYKRPRPTSWCISS